MRGGGGGGVAAVGPPPAVRGGGGGAGGVERKPQGRAWQMRRQKPARALLIKHNEAWDHKVFCLIPGSHGAGQISWAGRGEGFTGGPLGLAGGWNRASWEQRHPRVWSRAGVEGELSHRPPFQLGKRQQSETFPPRNGPSCWRPGTSHGPLWASRFPHEVRLEPKQKTLLA